MILNDASLNALAVGFDSYEFNQCFPYINVNSALQLTPYAIALYCRRASADNPITFLCPSIRDIKPTKNTVFFARVNDLFEYADFKNFGKEVKEAFALKKLGVEAKAFVNEDIRSGLVVIDANSTNTEHYFVMLLPKVTPWFFKENPLTQFEIELLKSNGRSDRYTKKIILEYDLAEKFYCFKMGKFVDSLLERKVSNLMSEEKSLLVKMAEQEEALRALQRKYDRINHEIIGVKASHDANKIEEFLNVLTNNPNCQVTKFSGATIEFVITGYLTNFSKTAYEAVSREKRASLYLGNYDPCKKKMFDELILGNRYKINFAGKFIFNFETNHISLCRTHSDKLAENTIPNPHIAQYACAGGFAQLYREAAGDYLETLDIAFSEVQNLNWTDTSPVSTFAKWIDSDYWSVQCVWDKVNKTYISPEELYQTIQQKGDD